jgi:hypothetical protein
MVFGKSEKHRSSIALGLLVLFGIAYLSSERLARRKQNTAEPPALPSKTAQASSGTLIGESILKDYAKTGSEPKNDLTWMHRAIGNFSLLVKGENPLPLGSNEEIAAALRGKNRAQLRFLPDDSPVFNPSGQIIDRWGSPLFFHATSRDRLDIRSAGPDREMWTADDLHRKHDGTTLAGAALPP